MLTLNVNGTAYQISVDPDTPLLWILREQLGLIGTKYSCGIGECGACNVHIDGETVPSCTVNAEEVADQKIITIEGLQGRIADALFNAWLEGDVPQCGYCQPGQIMQAAELLMSISRPTDRDIDQALAGVLCRCGTYQSIREAIHRAAREI